MHHDEISVSLKTVRELIDAQFPQWRGLTVERVASPGTVNAIFRIGDRFTARFPLERRETGAARQWLESEAEAARELFGRTRFPTPEPIAIAEPGAGYPLPWSVQTWLPGVTATDHDPGESVGFAYDLAEFISDVRAIDPRGRTFGGQGRGGDLRDHDSWLETCFQRSETLLDVPRLRDLWTVLRQLPRGEYADTMNHGDLIPGNVLVADSRLAGVLDVGGFGVADRALDLVSAWHLLEHEPRQTLRTELGCDDVEWERGKAWAFAQAMGVVWYYQYSNPVMSRMGQRTLARIMADSPYA